MVRRFALAAVLLLSACTIKKTVSCRTAKDCPSDNPCRIAAGATSGYCGLPEDLGGMPDLVPPPDLVPVGCTAPDAGAHAVVGCPIDMPVCDGARVCRACGDDSECDSGVCRVDGSCAATVAIAWVDRAGSCPGDGSAGTPYCQVSGALANLGSRTIVKVAGATQAYDHFSISAPVEIYGPQPGTATEAVVAGGTAHTVETTATSGTIVLAQLRLQAAPAGKDDLHCTDATHTMRLVLRDLLVVDAGGRGIASDGCTVDASRLRVLGNGAGGILHKTGALTIENALLANNAGPGLELDTADTVTLRFLTVANNVVPGTPTVAGGVHNAHTAVTVTVDRSIAWNNSKLAGSAFAGANGVQLVSNGSVAGADETAPDFRSASDYHLSGVTTNNLACCLDKATSGPALDVDRRHRPSGLAWDIGAHEVAR